MTRPRPVVLDTNVVSYLQKGDSRGDPYLPRITGRPQVIAFQTVAELEAWGLERRWSPERVERLREYRARYNVLPYSEALARRWAAVWSAARRKGRPIDPADAWIAATALELAAPLLTHNARDFEGVDGLEVVTATP